MRMILASSSALLLTFLIFTFSASASALSDGPSMPGMPGLGSGSGWTISCLATTVVNPVADPKTGGKDPLSNSARTYAAACLAASQTTCVQKALERCEDEGGFASIAREKNAYGAFPAQGILQTGWFGVCTAIVKCMGGAKPESTISTP